MSMTPHLDENFNSALSALQSGCALSVIMAEKNESDFNKYQILYLKGIESKNISNLVESKAYFTNAYEEAILSKNPTAAANCLVQLAQISHTMLDSQNSLEYLTLAVNIRMSANDHIGSAGIYVNMAIVSQSNSSHLQTLNYINLAQGILRTIDQDDRTDLLNLALINLTSLSLNHLGRYNESIFEMKRGIEISKHIGHEEYELTFTLNYLELLFQKEDWEGIGENLSILLLNPNINNWPEILSLTQLLMAKWSLKNKNSKESIYWAEKSYKYFSDNKDLTNLLNATIVISDAYRKSGSKEQAIMYALQALSLAESDNRKQVQVEALQLLADASEGSDPVAAVGYLRRLMAVQAELHEAARDRQLQELTAQAELESARRRVEYEQELRAQAEETIQHQLQELERGRLYDHLTDLPNRVLLHAQLAQRVSRSGGKFLLVSLDLNRFQLVNDTYGHDAADELLRVMGVRAAGLVGSDEMVARVGGDEFALILLGDSLPERLSAVLAALSEPVVLGEERVRVSWSAGAAYWPGDGQDAESLRQASELALSDAKTQGESVVFFDASLHLHAGLEGPLSRALQRGEFELHFQPLVDVSGRRVVCAEALLRWNSPEHGLQMPGTFMPILERSDAIVEVGAWVLREACRAAALWGGVRVAVNLSARQFASRDLRSVVLGALRDSGLPPACLELEITESLMMQSPERAARLLAAFQEDGVRVVLDDFGTGYSSLGYLARFPLSGLKIDRSFVSALEEKPDGHDAAIVRAVVGLSRDMRLELVAEGVESLGQVELLENLGVRIMQGYYFARPSAQWRPLNVPGVR